MAHLLAKLGEAALKPQKVGDVWRKAAISAKNVARLRREWLLAGKEWPYDPVKEVPKPRKPKGHKHDKQKVVREKAIEANMANMEDRVAAYRKSNQLQNVSLLDRLLNTPKQLRLKQRGGS
ncbi:hypothetical protein N2152v2_005479 [Parachlorella kessleri]